MLKTEYSSLFVQYHACWCSGSFSRQGIRGHDIDSIGYAACGVAPLWICSPVKNKIQDVIQNVNTSFVIFKTIQHVKINKFSKLNKWWRIIVILLWNLTGASAAVLPKYQSDFRAIRQFSTYIFRHWEVICPSIEIPSIETTLSETQWTLYWHPTIYFKWFHHRWRWGTSRWLFFSCTHSSN